MQGPGARLRPLSAQARRNGEVAAAEERRALLGSGDPLARMREREGRDGLVGTAAAATASLQRTRQLMAQARSPARGQVLPSHPAHERVPVMFSISM